MNFGIDGIIIRKGFYKIYSIEFEDEKGLKTGLMGAIVESELSKMKSLPINIDRFRRLKMKIKGDMRLPKIFEHEVALVVSKGDRVLQNIVF